MAKKFTGIKRKSLSKKSSAKTMAESNAKRARSTYSKRGKSKPIESKSAARKPKEKRTIRLMPLGENLVKQPPESPLTKKGKSVKGLLRNTPALMHHNSEDVRILSMKKTKTKSGLRAVKAKAIHQDPWRPDRTKKVRDVYIIGLSDPDKPISKQRKVLVSCNCLTGDTEVLTSKGWKTIYEIADKMDLENFPIKYRVNGKTYEGTAPFHTGVKPVYKMVFQNGESVEATKDHRFLVKPIRGDAEWKELQDIAVGDNLMLTANVGTKLPEKTNEFYHMQYLGFMQGDGSFFTDGRPDLRIFADDKKEMIEKFAQLEIITDVVSMEKNVERVKFNIHATELLRRYSYEHRGAPTFKGKEQFFGYLSGLLAADASVASKEGKIGSVLVRGDEVYLRPVFNALIRYGYSDSTLRLERTAGTKVGKMTASKDMHCLKISAKTFYRLKDYLELPSRFDAYEFKEFLDRKPTTKVTEKFYVANKPVYDIHVPIVNQFVIGGGVIAHNCENFVFTWEYANAVHGCSRVIYGNGEPPTYTNPQLVPALCKHITAVAKQILAKGL